MSDMFRQPYAAQAMRFTQQLKWASGAAKQKTFALIASAVGGLLHGRQACLPEHSN
jgi:hypothetical protein